MLLRYHKKYHSAHVEYFYFWDENYKDENGNGKSFTLDDIHKVLNVDILRNIQSGNKN